MTQQRFFALEQQAISPVPHDQRRGRSRELVAIWFGMNMSPITIVTGAGATTVFGLSLWWAFVAILAGHAIGGIGMALHAAQGPRLGVPQMLQARGQFGSYGAALIIVLALVMYIGVFASNLLVATDSFAAVQPDVDRGWVIIGVTLISLVISAFGYFLVRRIAALGSYIVGGLVVVAFIVIVSTNDIGSYLGIGSFNLVGFLSMLAIGVVWQLAYAPYVSDYSRYMPVSTGSRGAFWASFSGCVASSVLLMTVGAVVGLITQNTNTMEALFSLLGGWLGVTVLIAFGIVVGAVNSINLYSSCLCTLTLIETFRPGWDPRATARLVTTLALTAVGVILAFAASSDFVTFWFAFLSLLLYALIPWSAINLVDYYLLRHGEYVVSDFFVRGGGVYGRWNVAALLSFALGVLVQIPFMVLPFFTGGLAAALGGIDVAWLVGFALSGAVYYVAMRRTAVLSA